MRLIVAALLALALVGVAPPAWAQAEDGERLVALAEKSLADGKHELAVQQFTRALHTSSFPSETIARLLYRRAVAYREGGRHAQAVADLTAALWLNKLPAREAEEARKLRAESYAALGLADRGEVVAAGGGGGSPAIGAFDTRVEAAARQARGASQATAPPPAAEIAAFETRVEAAGQGQQSGQQSGRSGSFPALPGFPVRQTAPATPATAGRTAAAAAPEPPPSSAWSTSVAAEEQPERPAPPARSQLQVAAAEPRAGVEPQGGSLFGRWFGRLTGSGEAVEGREDAAPAAPAPAGQWGSTVEREAAAQPPTGQWTSTISGAGQAADGGGNYRLQLASVRSEEEAQAVWQRLASAHGELIGSRQPLIEKSELGALGTFYRVQIGPFADKKEPLQLCNAFKAGGVDCFIVSR